MRHYSKDGILVWFDTKEERKAYDRECLINHLCDWRTWALWLAPSVIPLGFLVGWWLGN